MSKNLKIAIVHDYLKEYGGAESVLETLADTFPQAQIFTTIYHPASLGPHRARIEKKFKGRIHQSFFKFIPFNYKLISPLRFLSPLAFYFMNFKNFDLIITSATGAYFPNSLNKKQARLICYCHTPPRYLYGLATARDLSKRPLINAVLQILFHFFRLLDFKYAQNVDQFIANSKTTALRIKKFYRKESLIINPPVYLPKTLLSSREGARRAGGFGFFLTGGRLARAKRYDIAIRACNKLKLPLKIFGRDFAGHESELKAIAGLPAEASAKAGPTIEFMGEVTQEQKADLFAQAQAFFMCSDNEDFGIVPVEAMAHGTPVIGYNSGGVRETVIDGKTGFLFDKLTVDSCIKAIQKFQKTCHSERSRRICAQACISRAQQFDSSVFIKSFQKLIFSI